MFQLQHFKFKFNFIEKKHMCVHFTEKSEMCACVLYTSLYVHTCQNKVSKCSYEILSPRNINDFHSKVITWDRNFMRTTTKISLFAKKKIPKLNSIMLHCVCTSVFLRQLRTKKSTPLCILAVDRPL